MGKLILILGIMCTIQNAHSSLPSLAEIKSRSRWCLGEGAHCPINLPFKFSSCCKPYLCTAIPKTHKPSLFMRFKDYKDHRCILPATDVQSESMNNSILQYDNFSTTESQLQSHESVTTEKLSTVDEHVEQSVITFDQNETNANLSHGNLGEDNERSLMVSNETYFNDNGRNKSHIVKRAISIYSSENNKSWSSENSYSPKESKDHNSKNSLESEMSSLDNVNLTLSSEGKRSELNFETSSEYNYGGNTTELQTNSSSSSSELLSYLIPNNTFFGNNSIIADSYNKNISLITTDLPTGLTNSSEEVEEDWTSSQVDYDTRPGLHKVVTIQPFQLFQSVELIKVNESVETSD